MRVTQCWHMQHKHLSYQSQYPIADTIDLYAAGGTQSILYWMMPACKLLSSTTLSLTISMEKNTHFNTQKLSELTLLHRQTLSATNTHMQTSTYASHDVNVKTHCAHNNIISGLLTRWDPLERQTALAPPNCPQSARWKLFFYENPHCLFLFSPLLLPEQWEEPRGRSFHSALTGVTLKKMVREGLDARMYKQRGVGTNQPSCILCPFFYFYGLIREN